MTPTEKQIIAALQVGFKGIASELQMTKATADALQVPLEKQFLVALIRGFKFLASLLEKVKKGEAV